MDLPLPNKKSSEGTPSSPPQPETFWGKILGCTPVVMTVVATLLAGLSTSEMTRAQYDRSLAAQQQAKVGDQWSFFQAKRQRGASLRSNLELLQATVEFDPLDDAGLRKIAGGAVSLPTWPAVEAGLLKGSLPAFVPTPATNSDVQLALERQVGEATDAEILQALKPIKPETLDAAVRSAQANTRGFDRAVSPVTRAIEELEKQLMTQSRVQVRGFTASRLRFDAARYDAEAAYNRTVAELIELQVRQSNASADRHNARSQLFFAGMLGAQLAVVLSSLGLALRRRTVLWGFAALIGVAAMIFGVYVFVWL